MSYDYSRLSDGTFYRQFEESSWNGRSEEERLALLQELENRVAREEGRKPMTIVRIPAKDERPGLMGYYQHGANCLFITGKFLRRSRLGLNDYSAAAAMSTVLHEGRHAYQHHIMEQQAGKMPDKRTLQWVLNTFCYCGYSQDNPKLSGALYVSQPLETDARSFARQRLRRINNLLRKANGAPDSGITRFLERDKQMERINASIVRSALTPEILDEVDELARERFYEANPDADIDLSDVSLFDEARRLLDGSESFDDYDEFRDEDRFDSFRADDALDRFAKWVLDKSRVPSEKPDLLDRMTYKPFKRGSGF